jgi:AIG2-like family
MFYFAYGSNMDCAQMRERCPSARFVGVAKLPDHRLAFSRKSRNRGCGVADAIETTGHDVWGVVYEVIDPEDVQTLDRCEGAPSGSYVRKESQLVFLRDDPEQPLGVSIYFAVKEDNPPLPAAEYKKLIVSAARFWQLPSAYIQELEQISVLGDDPERM